MYILIAMNKLGRLLHQLHLYNFLKTNNTFYVISLKLAHLNFIAYLHTRFHILLKTMLRQFQYEQFP